MKRLCTGHDMIASRGDGSFYSPWGVGLRYLGVDRNWSISLIILINDFGAKDRFVDGKGVHVTSYQGNFWVK